MKTSFLTPSNKVAMTEALRKTFAVRYAWIKDKKPLVKDVFDRFPRLQDMLEAVSNTT